MKVVFMGTPDFSVGVLKALIKKHDVVCVYTQPPRPAGRGQKLTPSPVQQEAEKHLKDMQELKVKVESLTVKVPIKVGANGKAFGSVSTKEIVEAFKEQNKIDLDKRKIQYSKTIDCLGTYKIPIELHKTIVANIKLFVVEKE